MATVKQRVRGFIRRLVKPLGLKGWHFNLVISKDMDDDNAMESSVNYEYKFLDIELSPDLKPDDRALYGYTIHELTHAIIEPLGRVALHLAGDDPAKRSIARDAEESVVTHLTDVFRRLLPEDKNA